MPMIDENGNEIMMAAAPKKHLNYERPWRDAMSKNPKNLGRNDSYISLQPKTNHRSPLPEV
jgi:hypothetical protein